MVHHVRAVRAHHETHASTSTLHLESALLVWDNYGVENRSLPCQKGLFADTRPITPNQLLKQPG